MKHVADTISAIILFMALISGNANAQTKAISTVWSPNGIGLGYEFYSDNDSFFQLDLKTEISEILMNRSWTPGALVSFTWNMQFADFTTRYGDKIVFYAGPGAAAGWSPDYGSKPGMIFGVKGRVGAECTFDRHVSISASIAPILGLHLSFDRNGVNMRAYRNGILYGVMPEIGIKFAFL